jgi:hypothetical protein
MHRKYHTTDERGQYKSIYDIGRCQMQDKQKKVLLKSNTERAHCTVTG